MSPDFKNFITGLLNKNPTERMNWPKLLEHPFVRETAEEKVERAILEDTFASWLTSGIFTNSSMVDLEMEKLVADNPIKNDGHQEHLNGSMWSN